MNELFHCTSLELLLLLLLLRTFTANKSKQKIAALFFPVVYDQSHTFSSCCFLALTNSRKGSCCFDGIHISSP